jgi:(4S)-4-hydroxy-5-phosphonooxypentane-2,3-dione isomerase
MSGFVVIVDFRLKPGSRSAFRRLVDTNATASVRDEPGCRRFDVLEVQGESDRVLLYEIYDDEAAFEQHCRTSHFHEFDAVSAPLVIQKTVSRCDLVLEPQVEKRNDAPASGA